MIFTFSGGFNLHGDGALEMVERILSMLSQYLMSNQSLEINNSFRIYLKILSIDHMLLKTRETRQHKKRTKAFFQSKKKTFGAKPTKTKFNFMWALDIPNSFHGEETENCFKNKCLLLCAVLGILQHEFFENKNKKFSLIEKSINSANKIKQHKAGILLNSEIEKVLKICNLPNKGPYDLDSTCSILSTIFKCQFIIFNAVTNGSNLLYKYPNIYDDSLKPIYMYQPNSTENHLIYIKKLSSFYNRNFRICFCCKKLFKARTSRAPWHLCPSKHSCFSCRRFYQSNTTYIHGNLKSSFCNRYLTNETLFPCNICNVTLYSQHCLESHRQFCAKTGNFGYYCENCKKFTYRQGKSNSIILKNTHKCNASKPCRNCFKSLAENETHQCELKKEKMPITWP